MLFPGIYLMDGLISTTRIDERIDCYHENRWTDAEGHPLEEQVPLDRYALPGYLAPQEYMGGCISTTRIDGRID